MLPFPSAVADDLSASASEAGAEAASTALVDIPTLTPLSHPVSLQDAIAAGAKSRSVLGAAVEGYKFESDVVVGEYWPTEDVTPEKFLREFESDTGTLPEVVGLLTMKSVPVSELRAAADKTLSIEANSTLSVDSPVFVAPPVTQPPASKVEANQRMLADDGEDWTAGSEAATLSTGLTVMPRMATVEVTTSPVWADTIRVYQNYQW